MPIIFIGSQNALMPWAGELVSGHRTPIRGLRKLRPHVELQSQMGQAERLGNGAETKRPPGIGYDALVMQSLPGWKR
jgi:hypothetical protein